MRNITPLLFLLVFWACKKDHLSSQEVSGIVLHNITRAPLPGQEVILKVSQFRIVKDDPIEFPDGKPVITDTHLRTVTDAAGRFTFSINVPDNWNFVVELVSNEYVQMESPVAFAWLAMTDLPPGIPHPTQLSRQLYDTIYAESPAYIKYIVNNTSPSFEKDTLYVATPFRKQLIWPSVFLNAPAFRTGGMDGAKGYLFNWMMPGAGVNRSVIDTIPGESITSTDIHWLHVRTDTIVYKKDAITISKGAVTEYSIQY